MALSPRESGKFVASLSDNVKIKEENVQNLGDIVSITAVIALIKNLSLN